MWGDTDWWGPRVLCGGAQTGGVLRCEIMRYGVSCGDGVHLENFW